VLAFTPDGALWLGAPAGLFRRTGAGWVQVARDPVESLFVAASGDLYATTFAPCARDSGCAVVTRWRALEGHLVGAFDAGRR
jgi:hypothetical protein